MSPLRPRPHHFRSQLCLGFILAGFFTSAALRADANPAADIPVEPGEIDRAVHLDGEHRTVIIEMVPEALHLRRAAGSATVAATPSVDAPKPAALDTTPEKPVHTLFWSITVYGDAPLCSVVEQRTADGTTWRVASGLDFRLLRPLANFASPQAEYHWFPAIADATPDEPARPAWGGLGSTEAPTYRVLSGQPSPEALAALDHLHAYYAENLAALRANYTARLAEEERRERELRENPPKRRDTIVRIASPDTYLQR